MSSWSLFPTFSADMPFQMALDEVLFRQMIESRQEGDVSPTPILRFFYSTPSWTTVGYSHPHNDQNLPENYCKRITGGGRVDHGNDLIFSLIAPKEADETFKTVRVAYWKIHEAVKLALENRGKKIRFYRVDEKLPRGGHCFTHPIASDLAWKEKKIAGGAQKRSMGILLHQESIQLQPKEALQPELLQEALIKGFEAIFEIELQPTKIDPEVIAQAEDLASEKYQITSELAEGVGVA